MVLSLLLKGHHWLYQRPSTRISLCDRGRYCFSRVLDEHGLQSGKFKRVNYPTETLTSGNERQAYSVHQSLN